MRLLTDATARLGEHDRTAMPAARTAESSTRSLEHATGAPTLPEMLLRSATRHTGIAMRFAVEGRWRELTYGDLAASVREIACGLVALGVRRGERVSILSDTRLEWTLADLGALCVGAVVVPIYPSDSPQECRYLMQHAGSRVVFCENREQLAKVAQVRGTCPQLEHLVAFEQCGPDALSLDQLRHVGERVHGTEPARIASALGPGDPATIVYTSGTTGPPKGCITTHGNVMQTAQMYEQRIDLGPGSVVFMFLPLAHSLARVTQMVVLDVGATIAYWRGDRGRLLDDLADTRPTHLPAVPRVFEKFYGRATQSGARGGRVRRATFQWALATGRRRRTLERGGRHAGPVLGVEHALADKLVLAKVRGLFGPDLELALTGAAPIVREVLQFFDDCGVLILEGYGTTETTAAATLNTASVFRFGTAGRALPGVELAIAGDGEVLVRGANVFDGYYRDDQATREALTDDGWLRSGDLGTIDDDGFLTITGKKKDIIVTAGGKNISPANIEAALRDIPWVSEAVVYGDRRPYLVALLTLDPDEAPALAARLGVDADVALMAGNERVLGELAHAVGAVNDRFARAEQIKSFVILDHELTQQAGELTPTMKVKRAVVYDRYRDVFHSLYD